MKVSNVIKFLETQKKDHGDLDVFMLRDTPEGTRKSLLDFFVVNVAQDGQDNKFVMVCSREKANELVKAQGVSNGSDDTDSGKQTKSEE